VSIIEALEHIRWSLDHSPTTYTMYRAHMIDLRQQLVNCELRYQERHEPERQNQARNADKRLPAEQRG
jgi:hypothetical protein